MGQKLQSPIKNKKQSLYQNHDIYEPSDRSNIALIENSPITIDKNLSQLYTETYTISERASRTPQATKEQLEREEKLLQFIGEIIYYCKLHMKKQRKYHYKISALLFYKYFFDKFRQLLAKNWILYQKQEISRYQYEKKVSLVYEVKETFVKIKKFVYSKIPFMSQTTKSYLDENSNEYCFEKKQFFTELLYRQVRDVMEFYSQNTQERFEDFGINTCYLRMIKGIFIIEELQFKNCLIQPKENQNQPNYEIDKIDGWQQDKTKQELIKSYKLFLSLERS